MIELLLSIGWERASNMVLADHERDELLNDYIDGRLAESERQQVESLLAQDDALRAELELTLIHISEPTRPERSS